MLYKIVVWDNWSPTGRRLAVAVPLVAAFVLFKVVLGFLSAIAWIVIVVVALVAVVWALRVLWSGIRRHRLLLRALAGTIGKIKGSSFGLWFLIGALPAAARDDCGDLLALAARRAAPPVPRVRQRRAARGSGLHALRPRPRIPDRGRKAAGRLDFRRSGSGGAF